MYDQSINLYTKEQEGGKDRFPEGKEREHESRRNKDKEKVEKDICIEGDRK